MDHITVLYLKCLFDLSNKDNIIEDIDIFLNENDLKGIDPYLIYNELSNFIYNL